MSIPKKTMDILPKDWKKTALDMFTEGAAQIQVIKAIGLTVDLHKRFVKDYEEYRDFMVSGMELAECWWVKTGKENLNNRNFNNPLFNTLTARLFKWNKDDDGKPPAEEKEDSLLSKYKKRPEEEASPKEKESVSVQ